MLSHIFKDHENIRKYVMLNYSFIYTRYICILHSMYCKLLIGWNKQSRSNII